MPPRRNRTNRVPRYKLTIAYRGTAYHGWQFQHPSPTYKTPLPDGETGIPTIQRELTRALQSVVRHPVNVVGSSRTDTGVHAKGQVVHFDTDRGQIPLEGLRRAANHALPSDILIRRIEPVDESFSAIRSTVAKRYQYLIHNAPDRDPFAADLMWHRWQAMDLDAMAATAQCFVGTHDFASFTKPGHGRATTIRTVLDCSVRRRAHRIVIGISGTGFLWNMVRIIVGTLVEVGLGRYGPQQVISMLSARDRQAAGPTAPAHGLYLQWIRFASPGTASPDIAPADTTPADTAIDE